MTDRISRVVAVGAAALLGATALAASPAQAKNDNDKPNPSANMSVQLLSFNDYHGHLEANDPALAADVDPAKTSAGGAANLSTKLTELRSAAGDANVTGRSSSSILPSSGATTPAMILIRVDLPAPFSPRTAWMRPASIVRPASCSARTPP